MRSVLALACGLGVACATSSSVIGWSSVPGTFRTEESLRDGVAVFPPALFKNIDIPTTGASVVFVQSGVELDDIARFGGIYGETKSAIVNIKDALEGASSTTFVPAVTSLSRQSIVTSLSSAEGSMIEVDALEFANARITISASNQTTIVVTLPSVAGAVDMAAALAKNDALIGDITKELERFNTPLCVMVVSIGSQPFGAATNLRSRTRRSTAIEGTSSTIRHQCTSSACRYPRDVGKPTMIMFFSTTVMMGIVVCGLMVVIFLTGTFGLMVLAINDGKFPDPTDDDLIISTRNE
mmetsp:Transcript_78512/g.109112  ORF Transcript_78512/g.109112 Transcript_78512/m.109112 type:complete len:296 (-) Transcript_78512:54-941(-)